MAALFIFETAHVKCVDELPFEIIGWMDYFRPVSFRRSIGRQQGRMSFEPFAKSAEQKPDPNDAVIGLLQPVSGGSASVPVRS
jgi:hypothetical protein